MKICVLVKQVPGSDSPLKISDDQSWINEENVNFITNESDNYAVEEALQLKEKLGEGEVVAVSLGPERTQRTIREALSKGADRVFILKSLTLMHPIRYKLPERLPAYWKENSLT